MPIPTVNQIALQLVQETGESTSNVDYVTTVERWVQECVDAIGDAKRWAYLYSIGALSTVASTRTYNLTVAFAQEIAVRYTDGSGILTATTKDKLINSGEKLTRTAKPTFWYPDAYDITNEILTLGLHPTPDAVYALEFFGFLVQQELSSSSKLPFPRNFIRVLKDGVRAKIREDDRNYQGASIAYRNFIAGIRDLVSVTLVTAEVSRLGYSDLAKQKNDLVRLPPDHFRNY